MEQTRPLRILAVVNLAWDPRLGAVRVWTELAEEWRAAGHTVDAYCLSDAFPNEAASPPLFALRQVLFARKAAAFIRKNWRNYDVIDALIGTLPYSKRRLNFRGLLVARSVGLYRLYERFEQKMACQNASKPRGKFLGRLFYRQVRRRVLRDSDRSVRHADVINLPNEEEATCLCDEMRPAGRILVLPYGLAPERSHALAAAALPPEARLAQQRVAFVGMWSPRKGAHDWAGIIRAVRAEVPGAQFRFLGTMVDAQVIRDALGDAAFENIECVSHYQPDDLPGLLADCTAGAFPSYVEGFGLAVIEQLAAGLPTVAYDTAGPRDILQGLPASLLVPPGDVGKFADSLLQLLGANAAEYQEVSQQSLRAAEKFSWPEIARATIDAYRRALAEVDS